MKALLMLLLSGAIALSPSSVDENWHSLGKQWKEYNEARLADKPQDALKALSAIKKEAFKQRLAWDYYDAGQQFVDVSCYRNWKLRDSLQTRFGQEIKDYDRAITSFYYDLMHNKLSGLEGFVAGAEKELRSGKNEGFYHGAGLGLNYSEFIINHIENDYEFALWQLYSRNRSAEKLAGELTGLKKDLLEYFQTPSDSLESFAKAHQGKVVALAARGRLLLNRFDELNGSQKGKSEDYKALKADCTSFEKERKAFSGEEKELASLILDVKFLIEELNEKNVCASVEGDTLSVIFQNVPDALVSIESEGKAVFSKTILNDIRSYYVEDTVKCSLPAINDGDYMIKVSKGNIKEDYSYNKRSLAILLRKTSSGHAIFVTDCRTGEPVRKVNVSVLKKDKELYRQEGLVLDGFTALPSGVLKALSEKNSQFVCDFTDAGGILHKSQEMDLDRAGYSTDNNKNDVHADIFTNCGAFHKNDIVEYKAIFYSGSPSEGWSVLDKGQKAEAVLYDSENKEVARQSLTLNEFGAAAGQFTIPDNRRNGMFRIQACFEGRQLISTSFRVDDFVLPSFEILFDETGAEYLPGDTVKISGRINSYSGHKLSSAKVTAEVSGKDHPVQLLTDGSFSLEIPSSKADNYQYYNITVKVTDETGESLEGSRYVSIQPWLGLNLELENKAEGQCEVLEGQCEVLDGNLAKIKVNSKNIEGLSGSYVLSRGGKTLKEGSVGAPGQLELPLEGPSGLYTLAVKVRSKNGKEERNELKILKIGAGDTTIEGDGIENVFLATDGNDPTVRFGGGEAPLWVVVDLIGANGTLLASDLIPVKKGGLHTIQYKYRKEFGRAVTMFLSYFRNCRHYSYSHTFTFSDKAGMLPLEFSRFEEKGRPGAGYRFCLKTAPGSECAVTVFDKSTEAIYPNLWRPVGLPEQGVPWLYYGSCCGNESSGNNYSGRGIMLTKSAGAVYNSAVMADGADVLYSRVAVESEESAPADNGTYIRQDFSTALAFEPFLYPDADGNVEFSFRTSDKLSAFIVQAFAHNRVVNSATARKEMVVSIPVKVALYEPEFAYCGDIYTVKATVSSNSEDTVEGICSIKVFDGSRNGKLLAEDSAPMQLASGGTGSSELTLTVPEVKNLGILVSFAPQGQGGSDALYVDVPVKKAAQRLTEAYSAVLRSGASREELVEDLRSRFVNVSSEGASVREISILDMVREAIPQSFDADAKDIVALSDNWMGAKLAQSIGGGSGADVEDMEKRIMACRDKEGGFAWFEGFEPSPVLTVMLLQRIWFIKERGLDSGLQDVVADAVKYLDKEYFSVKKRPFWLGGISLEEYLLVRSMYSDVPLDGVAAKDLKDFRKKAKAYLLPRKERGLNGEILDKSRRMLTLSLLSEAPQGGFDAGIGSTRKMIASRDADLASLLQYAVEHPSGGTYFPNAVMPWRGLMESELCAHALLCELLSRSGHGDVADGVRLWMMVQKETQKWESDPGFLEALATVLDGSEAVLSTKVVVLSKEYDMDFEDIKSFGNGFKLKAEYLKDGVLLSDGDVLNVGDKIQARYSIWNEENRSFVRLSAVRPACFRPANQNSGRTGYWSYQGYRNVLPDRTEIWYESYPEEDTTVTEDLYVTQKGVFQSPAPEIECLYASHYRAADEACTFKTE